MNESSKIKLIAIVGPTGTGKTQLSIDLAKKFNAEIINADSRAIYKGADIASAKPSIKERNGIEHHLFDIAQPNEVYTVSQYKEAADKIIKDIVKRGKLPMMVGGTGLYFNAVINNYSFPPQSDKELKIKLENQKLDELLQQLDELDPEALNLVDRKNKRRVVRALEVCVLSGKKFSQLKTTNKSIYQTLWLGIKWDLDQLKIRLENRADKMLKEGVLEETKRMIDKYDFDLPVMSSIGYPIWAQYLCGEISLDEAKNKFARGDYLLAKKQTTWFKKNQQIHWLGPQNALIQAKKLLESFLFL